MAKDAHWAEINGKRIRLSNLSKILYPGAGISKAEVVQFFLQIAPYMLKHVKHRPMSFVRYPDGISGTSFYQKDRPAYTPNWVKGHKMGHNTIKEYVIIEEVADVVWLSTMACLEMHQMQVKTQNDEQPDQIIFDLDPSPGLTFETVKEVCYQLKIFLENKGFQTFVKTSGGKGLHIFIPIKSNVTSEFVKSRSKILAAEFVKMHPAIATLHLPKNKRINKILIDIYRNALYSTVIAPYSLRGKPGAPVSMPFHWDDLEQIESAQHFQMQNVIEIIRKKGDPWHEISSSAFDMHKKTLIPVEYKVPVENLKPYYAKRDFSKTPEPRSNLRAGNQNRFVIHRHLASRLHYDLRLEDNGTLKCWALPKGLPFNRGEKRLAIQTEDHPVSYLNFEGTIPKGQYGAGVMDIFLNGTFEWRTKSAGSYTFKLFTQSVLFDFLIYRTKEDQWIIEYQGEDTEAIFNNDYTHMLASQVKEVPEGGDWQFEVKWDGIRAFLVLKGETVTIKSRSGRDITHLFPEITEAAHHLKCHTAILDGEIVVLDKVGRSVFKNVMSRMHTKGVKRIKQLSRAMPATLYLFDTVFVDGVDVRETILKLRQKWLRQIVARPGAIRAAEALYEGLALYHAAEKMGLEGIIAKRILSKYQMGTRSPDWVKIKFHSTAECIILGFTAGEGNRSTYFGSLHLGQYEGLKLVYRGRVGTGFDSTSLKECYHILSVIPTTKKPFKEIIQEEKATTWIEPRLKCEIQYASMTDNGSFREPVFIKLLDGGNV